MSETVTARPGPSRDRTRDGWTEHFNSTFLLALALRTVTLCGFDNPAVGARSLGAWPGRYAMRTFAAHVALLAILLAAAVVSVDTAARTPAQETAPAPAEAVPDHGELTGVVQRYCRSCHNDRMLTGNLSLEDFDVGTAASSPEEALRTEKMIRKLRAGMMPPPGVRRPEAGTLTALVETLESVVDQAAADNPNPGYRTFQRLNRYEYERAVDDLLGLRINAGDYLPLDTMSANFDNIADVQMLSATLLDGYLRAATEVAQLAIGNPNAAPRQKTYSKSRAYSQWERVEGAPYGTRGGFSVVHNFPADGDYLFSMAFQHTTTGGLSGSTIRNEQIEISIDGEPVALLAMDQWLRTSDPNGVNLEIEEPIFVRAGPHRVSAVFVQQFEGPVEDVLAPHEWSIVDTEIGDLGYGVTALPHMRDFVIDGPYDVTGVSEMPSRQRIFTCRPTSPATERPCAEEIVTRIATRAYRRPLTKTDLADLMAFYGAGLADGGWESGIRTALQATLASPDFLFRLERPADAVEPGENYRVSDVALASRLAFFLWAGPPDEELIALAAGGKLSDPDVLDAQTRRLLADPRSESLSTRFAALWLRLQDMDQVQPDAFWFPNFDRQLADAMHRETELLFDSLVREDRSFFDLFTADYTFVNERLARHYGLPNVAGPDFRRVRYPDDRRRGLFGHGSVLMLTSMANRTSPVLRGKWVLEVILGTPPPPPPPAIPDLDETATVIDGRALTTRERMEIHRTNPTCNACHRFMDPLGLALDNFDVIGKWRIRENGMPLDTRGEMWDGRQVSSPQGLREALRDLPIPLARTFTENLMAYALGRRVEHYDMPTVRAITEAARANDYRMSSFILGVINSPAFRMQRAEADGAETEAQ